MRPVAVVNILEMSGMGSEEKISIDVLDIHDNYHPHPGNEHQLLGNEKPHPEDEHPHPEDEHEHPGDEHQHPEDEHSHTGDEQRDYKNDGSSKRDHDVV